MEIVAVIPARFASTRLPGKPLLSETGWPLIQHVVEAARRAQSVQRIIVATDDARIARPSTRFGGEAMMTRADHPTGTDRVAEVAARIEKARIIVNIQGDEPEIAGETIDRLVAAAGDDSEAPHGHAGHADPRRGRLSRPVVRQGRLLARGRALYFSRSPIPCHRDGLPEPGDGAPPGPPSPGPLRLSPRLPAPSAACPARPWRPPRSSSSFACSRPAPDRHRHRRRALASASTRRRTTGGSWNGGRQGNLGERTQTFLAET